MSTIASTGGAASTGAVSGAASTAGPTSTGVSAGASAGWGDDWRTKMAGGNPEELRRLERFESPDTVYRSYREIEKRMSAGELKPVLAKDATPTEVEAYRKAHGIPTKAEDYKITMPAGKQAPKEDDAFLKSFLASAHAQHYTQPQVDAAISTFYAAVDQTVTAREEADAAAVQATDDKLHQEWGTDYRVNKTLAENLLARAPAGFKDRFMNGTLDDGTPLKASVDAWKWLVQLEREINPAGTVVPGAGADVGKTIEAELNDLKKLMGNPASEYWKGPTAEAKQERYRQLIEAQGRIKARAAA